jgi:hypothetical protein
LQQVAAVGGISLAEFDQRVAGIWAADSFDRVEQAVTGLNVPPPALELRGIDGTATLDRDAVTLVLDRRTTQDIKRARSPRRIPLGAVASVEYEPRGSGGYLRIRLAGEAPGYQPHRPQFDANAILLTPGHRSDDDEFVAELRQRVTLAPRRPVPELLPPQARLPGLAAPPWGELFCQLRTGAATVTVDENGVLLDFRSGPKRNTRRWLPMTAIAAVEFVPHRRLRSGHVRFMLAGLPAGYRHPPPATDPDTFTFIGGREEGAAEDLAAQVAARITGPRAVEPALLPGNDAAHLPVPPQPRTESPPTVPPPLPTGPGADAASQLRELARLRAEGLINNDDYDVKKQEILRRW